MNCYLVNTYPLKITAQLWQGVASDIKFSPTGFDASGQMHVYMEFHYITGARFINIDLSFNPGIDK